MLHLLDGGNKMDLANATSEQISQYKESWKHRGFVVQVPSNMDVKGKDWCRHKLERWVWGMEAFADEGHHEFIFEQEKVASRFAKEFDSEVKPIVTA